MSRGDERAGGGASASLTLMRVAFWSTAVIMQEIAAESDDFIELRNPGGYFDINRKTGGMDLIEGDRKVDRIACRKHDSDIPIPRDEPATNTFQGAGAFERRDMRMARCGRRTASPGRRESARGRTQRSVANRAAGIKPGLAASTGER